MIERSEHSLTTHDTDFYSNDGSQWDLNQHGYWVGGYFQVSNLSNGYHGIMKQWWDAHAQNVPKPRVLLLSESQKVKEEFVSHYPNWDVLTLDMYHELTGNKPDIIGDICSQQNPLSGHKFDVIISQATLEHVYNPFQAMFNLLDALDSNGVLVTHTHPPGFGYHRYPADYIRFMKDWWFDLPNFIPNIKLLYMYMYTNTQVFTCYQKV